MVKNAPANAWGSGSIPGSRGSPGGGNGNPLQYFLPENSIDRRAWQTAVHKFHRQRNLAGYSPWAHKELDVTEHAHTYTGSAEVKKKNPPANSGDTVDTG